MYIYIFISMAQYETAIFKVDPNIFNANYALLMPYLSLLGDWVSPIAGQAARMLLAAAPRCRSPQQQLRPAQARG